MSKKFDQIQRNISTIKHEKLEQQIENFGYVRCECCGRSSGVPLDASHLVPRSFSIALQDHPDNIWLHCRICHRRWERNDITMPKFAQMMSVVQRLSPTYFQLRLK